MINVAIFVSGNGTNCENIIRHFTDHKNVKIALVLSNKIDAYALTRARNLGVPAIVMTRNHFNDESQMMVLMRAYHIDFIVLAGFLQMIPDFLIRAYDHRILNIHPALLPKFGGKGMYGHYVHEAVKAAGETETGMTVHWVNSVCDGGEIIAQFHTPLSPTDSPADIAAKEHVISRSLSRKFCRIVSAPRDFIEKCCQECLPKVTFNIVSFFYNCLII